MTDLSNLVLARTDDFNIKTSQPVHSGKVRSVYWLTSEDSKRLIEQNGYVRHPNAQLGLMIISDKISAFDVNWKGENGLHGIPGKGAVLNAMSEYWFTQFEEQGLAPNHIVDKPHPLVWLVERTKPVLVEGIARQYITGSMWRAYSKGNREFCGITLPDGLEKNQQLEQLLFTPTTKGTLPNIPGVPEKEDTAISLAQIRAQYEAFNFETKNDVNRFETLVRDGFVVPSNGYAAAGQIFVDTKFEIGYGMHPITGELFMMYIDEVATPDSSRTWNEQLYAQGIVREDSKEDFREELKKLFGEDILTNDDRVAQRKQLAAETELPVDLMMRVSNTYTSLAERVMGEKPPQIENAREEILDALQQYQVLKE